VTCEKPRILHRRWEEKLRLGAAWKNDKCSKKIVWGKEGAPSWGVGVLKRKPKELTTVHDGETKNKLDKRRKEGGGGGRLQMGLARMVKKKET